jgi:hypothetical protein
MVCNTSTPIANVPLELSAPGSNYSSNALLSMSETSDLPMKKTELRRSPHKE